MDRLWITMLISCVILFPSCSFQSFPRKDLITSLSLKPDNLLDDLVLKVKLNKADCGVAFISIVRVFSFQTKVSATGTTYFLQVGLMFSPDLLIVKKEMDIFVPSNGAAPVMTRNPCAQG